MDAIDIAREQLRAFEEGKPFATVTIVDTKGTTSRSYSKMLVFADGTSLGTVGGSHNILNYPEYSDVEKARAFLSVLEEKEKLMALFSGPDEAFSVRIGPEMGMPEMADCSVVTASYQVGRGHHGYVGVIGPTRMPYGSVLSALSAIGGALSEMLGE